MQGDLMNIIKRLKDISSEIQSQKNQLADVKQKKQEFLQIILEQQEMATEVEQNKGTTGAVSIQSKAHDESPENPYKN